VEGSTPLLFSPELPSHCTSPLDLSPRWGPVDSPLLSSCGLTQQLNISAVSWNTSPACESFFSDFQSPQRVPVARTQARFIPGVSSPPPVYNDFAADFESISSAGYSFSNCSAAKFVLEDPWCEENQGPLESNESPVASQPLDVRHIGTQSPASTELFESPTDLLTRRTTGSSTDRNPMSFLTGLLMGFKTGVAFSVLLGQRFYRVDRGLQRGI